jgi:hypothetical protein
LNLCDKTINDAVIYYFSQRIALINLWLEVIWISAPLLASIPHSTCLLLVPIAVSKAYAIRTDVHCCKATQVLIRPRIFQRRFRFFLSFLRRICDEYRAAVSMRAMHAVFRSLHWLCTMYIFRQFRRLIL